MKIFIITEGGEHTGFGHVARCVSLYQAFAEKAAEPELIINGDDSILGLLKDERYQIFDWLQQRDRLFEVIADAEIAVIDSYLADISFYECLADAVKTPVYIDDNKRLNYPKGIVINGGINAEDLDYPAKPGSTYLLGAKYALLQKDFWDVLAKEIKEEIDSVMITFGGVDGKNMTPGVLKLLAENYSAITKNVVVGKDFQNVEAIKKVSDNKTNLIYYPDAEQMRDIMREADIAISAGGQTLYELARVGVPTAVVAVAENQLSNIEGCQKAGFIEYVGRYNDKDLFENMGNLLERLDYKKRKTIDQIGRRFVDGQGARRAVKELLAQYVKSPGKDDEK